MEVISDMNDFDINNTDSLDNSTENPVLDKIVNELSTLRNEMASIKAELDMLKKSEGGSDSADDIKLPNTEAEESTGFFSGDEDDETIALSGDELNNILNSAAFTEETAEPETATDAAEPEEPQTPSFDDTPEEPEAPAEMPVSEDDSLTYDDGEGPDTSIDFNENVSEPVIDDINFDIDNEENQAPEELPDEIDIPSSEDSFVVDAAPRHDFLEDNDPTLDEALSSDKVSYLNEDSLDNVTFGEANEETADDFAPETFGSSVEPPLGEDIDDTPAESVFDGEQWKPEPETEGPSFDAEPVAEPAAPAESNVASMPDSLKNDVKSVLAYMDQLLENLPEEKIAEFAKSEHFEVYKKLFTELGLA